MLDNAEQKRIFEVWRPDGDRDPMPPCGIMDGPLYFLNRFIDLPRLLRFPRLRFTIRRLMVIVAIVSLIFSWVVTVRNSREAELRRSLAAYHAREEEMALRAAALHKLEPDFISFLEHGRSSEAIVSHLLQHAANEAKLKRKYEKAARYPWLPVAPDPPKPK